MFFLHRFRRLNKTAAPNKSFCDECVVVFLPRFPPPPLLTAVKFTSGSGKSSVYNTILLYANTRWSSTELFPRFCCWTLIWLSRHWAWLRRGYWLYRSLNDWLIDWLIEQVHFTVRRVQVCRFITLWASLLKQRWKNLLALFVYVCCLPVTETIHPRITFTCICSLYQHPDGLIEKWHIQNLYTFFTVLTGSARNSS